MKICIINNLYPPHVRGGAEQVVVKTVQGLLEAGHEVIVLTTNPHPLPVFACGLRRGELTSLPRVPRDRHYKGEDRLKIYCYHPANIFFYTDAHRHGVLARLLWHIIDTFHIGSSRYVEQVLRQEKPDVVHTHNLMGMSFLIPRVIRRLGLRHVHTVHDVQLVEPSGIIRKKLEHSWRYTGLHIRLYSVIMRWLMGSPNVVISPSQFLLKFYEARGFFPASQRVVLRNPVTSDDTALPRMPHQGVNFLYLGQIEEHKGVLFLVQTFLHFLEQTQAAAWLHIAGIGSALPQIQEKVRGTLSIVIHGKVERDELPALFCAMDMTIVPSLCYENSPTVIFESFSFGVPVLASRVEGIAELITEGENGMTFTTEDAAALQEKLAWCMTHPERLTEMSQKIVQSKIGLSQGEYIAQLLELYQKSV